MLSEEWEDEQWDVYERQCAEEEAAYFENVKALAHFCPQCGVKCGEPDFEPDDPSVGIFGWFFANWCDVCNAAFYTYDSGTQEMD